MVCVNHCVGSYRRQSAPGVWPVPQLSISIRSIMIPGLPPTYKICRVDRSYLQGTYFIHYTTCVCFWCNYHYIITAVIYVPAASIIIDSDKYVCIYVPLSMYVMKLNSNYKMYGIFSIITVCSFT